MTLNMRNLILGARAPSPASRKLQLTFALCAQSGRVRLRSQYE